MIIFHPATKANEHVNNIWFNGAKFLFTTYW